VTPAQQHDFGDFAAPARESEAAVLSVADLTRRIAGRLADLGPLVVEGELGPPKRASSGHLYFELKEPGAIVACVVWRSALARAVPPHLADGAKVRVHGRLDVYAPRGTYSFVVERIVPVGAGELLARFVELKRSLEARGWFARKRPLPRLARCVGIVTSRDGAALRDILRTRSLRWPGFPVTLCHAPVQGPGAADAIARSIADLAATGVDVIVVGRGGGSLEDLWAFNEEAVARAIWECPVPVVSAVGHETDTTISDFVADVRAHTPTDAASIVFPERDALVQRLERARAHLDRALYTALDQRTMRLERIARSAAITRPERLLEMRVQRLANLRSRLGHTLATRIADRERRLARVRGALQERAPNVVLEQFIARTAACGQRASAALVRALERRESTLAVRAATLDAISPLRVLARGYSVTTVDGRAIVDASAVPVGALLSTRVANGTIESIARGHEVRE
jgi:exodeoxyribonuclease VII large subunit